MQVDAGEFIGKLRDRLALRIDVGLHAGDIMAAFDRSCVEVLVDEHQEKPLTSGQKAARTRARNRATREALGSKPLTDGKAEGASNA